MARAPAFFLLTLEFSWHALTLDPRDTVGLCFASCDSGLVLSKKLPKIELRGNSLYSKWTCCQHSHSKQTSLKAAATLSEPAVTRPKEVEKVPHVVTGEKTMGQRRAQAERRLKGMREAARRGTVPLKYLEVGKLSSSCSPLIIRLEHYIFLHKSVDGEEIYDVLTRQTCFDISAAHVADTQSNQGIANQC